MRKELSLPIIDIAYKLAFECNKAVVKFPRHQRPGIGPRIEETALQFLDNLTRARSLNSTGKTTALTEASHYLDTLRLLMRLSSDLKYLPIKKYAELAWKKISFAF